MKIKFLNRSIWPPLIARMVRPLRGGLSRGYATSEAASGHEAIETGVAVRPNLISCWTYSTWWREQTYPDDKEISRRCTGSDYWLTQPRWRLTGKALAAKSWAPRTTFGASD